MTPSPAADGCLVCTLDLYSYLPVLVAAHQWDARRDQRDSSCATQDLGCVQSLFTSSPLFVMLLETIVWFPKLMQPALEFSNSCGSRCAGWWGGPGKTESCCSSKLQHSSMTFLIKCSHPTFAVLQSNAFSFNWLPKIKTAQTDRQKERSSVYSHAIWRATCDSEIMWIHPTHSSGKEKQLVCSLQPIN